ncbi:MAG: SGNH/GDSL hydrolase family protein [Planctomycetota bacterium]
MILTFLFCDAALWFLAPVEHPYADRPLNRFLDLHPQGTVTFESDGKVMPGVSGPNRFTINAFGFRSPRLQSIDKPIGVRRIFCIGGSTTECAYIDDKHVWTEHLNEELQAKMPSGVTVDVINAGRAGDSTREHITMLAQRVIPYDPDLVIVLAGINDLVLQMAADYSPCRTDRRAIRNTYYLGWKPKAKYLSCSASQIMRRIVLVRRGRSRRGVSGNFLMDLKGNWMYTARQVHSTLPIERLTDADRYPRSEFEQNLRSLIGVCRAHEIPIVLLTQPSLFRSDLNEHEKSLLWVTPGGRRYCPGDMASLMDRYNECTRNVAERFGVPLVDLAAELPRDTGVFYDDCHFNFSGSDKVATIIAAALLNHTTPVSWGANASGAGTANAK